MKTFEVTPGRTWLSFLRYLELVAYVSEQQEAAAKARTATAAVPQRRVNLSEEVGTSASGIPASTLPEAFLETNNTGLFEALLQGLTGAMKANGEVVHGHPDIRRHRLP